MSEKIENTNPPNIGEMVLDLDFVPTWARSDSGVSSEIKEKEVRERPYKKHRDKRKPVSRPTRERFTYVKKAPVRVDFIPEQHRLKKVAQVLRKSKRAFPLKDIAARFMTHSAFYQVKCQILDSMKDEQDALYQNKQSRLIFLDREACEQHTVEIGLNTYFEVEETEGELPAGNFVCVGRCILGGEILGPPNFHGYAKNIHRLYSEKYAHMDIETLRQKIELVHEEDELEKWKKEQSRKYRYREKKGGEDWLTKKEAEDIVRNKYLHRMIKVDRRCIIPGTEVAKLADVRFKKSIELALRREMENLFSIVLALRPALKYQKLTLFRTSASDIFVTAVPPSPLLKDNIVNEIKEVLSVIKENPGKPRQFLLEALGEKQENAKILTSLRWLIDRGHVVEFYDGTLTVSQKVV